MSVSLTVNCSCASTAEWSSSHSLTYSPSSQQSSFTIKYFVNCWINRTWNSSFSSNRTMSTFSNIDIGWF